MKRILIVDDEKSLATALKEGFNRHKKAFVTDVAFSAEDAFELFATHPYSVVVSDIRLPKKSGLDVLLKLREEQPDAAFIAMTAFSSPAVEQQVREMGGFNYLEKPIEFEELERLVLSYVDRSPDSGSLLQSLELSSVVQLINMEGKTLVLSVSSSVGEGYLSFRKGELVDASFLKLKGEKAALAMFSMHSCKLRVASGKRVGKKTIKTPLMNLLMKAMKDKDESAETAGNSKGTDDMINMVDVEMLEKKLKVPFNELRIVKGFVSAGVFDTSGALLSGKGMEDGAPLSKVERDLAHLLKRATAAFSAGGASVVRGIVLNFSKGTILGERVQSNKSCFHLMVHIAENGNLTMARKAVDRVNAVLSNEA